MSWAHDMFKFLRPVREDKVYHYTTLSALKAILETQSLHLSHILCSNDYTEFENGIRFFWDEWLVSAEKERKFIDVIGGIKRCGELKDASLYARKKTNCCFLSCCFGKKSDDLLNQWRVYAQDGFGVAIGFDTKVMEDVCRINGFFLGECLYRKDDKNQACDTLAEQLQKELNNEHFKSLLLIYTTILGLFFKNECFKEEQEARIATYPKIALDIKERANRLVAFYCLDIKEKMTNLIKEVVIGPCHVDRYDETHKMVEVLLQKAGIGNCAIRKSVIPYRSYKI